MNLLLRITHTIISQSNADSSWIILYIGERGGVVGYGTALQAGRSQVRFLIVSLEFFIDSRTMALGSPQPPPEMSTSKGGRCIPPSCTDCLEISTSTSWNPQGLSRRLEGLLDLYLHTHTHTHTHTVTHTHTHTHTYIYQGCISLGSQAARTHSFERRVLGNQYGNRCKSHFNNSNLWTFLNRLTWGRAHTSKSLPTIR